MSLKVENLVKEYKKPLSSKPPFMAVKGVSFHIEPGEIYALLGPNGAGKSTIVKMIAGLIRPTSGRVLLNGAEAFNGAAVYQHLSAILEGTRNVYWRMTPLENLHYFANLRGVPSHVVREKAEDMLKTLEIDGKKKNQSQHLSRGMLQKLALAAALITDPQIILLDEPTLGLDVSSSRKIKEILFDLAKKQKKTILLTTHQMELVDDLADRVGIIREGKLAIEGSIAKLKSIFQNYIYTIRVKGSIDAPKEWIKKFDAVQKQKTKEFSEIEVDCKTRNGLFQILAELKRKNKDVLVVERNIEDLEEIFLRVLAVKPT